MQHLYNTYKGPINLLAGFIIAFVALNVIDTTRGTSTDSGRIVYTTCMSAYVEHNGASEQACDDAQDKYKYEFLCGAPEEHIGCWVESNDQIGK